jgi:hypothetical protein
MRDRPELGAAGKERIPVRWLLSHQAGLPVVDGPLTFEDACAWHPVIRALGFLVGEVVRRITGGRLAPPSPSSMATVSVRRAPDAGVGFGHVTNLWSFRIGEPRASNLAAAVVARLG